MMNWVAKANLRMIGSSRVRLRCQCIKYEKGHDYRVVMLFSTMSCIDRIPDDQQLKRKLEHNKDLNEERVMDESVGFDAFDDSCLMYRTKTYLEGFVLHLDYSNKAWRQCWMVLQGTALFLFASCDTSSDNMIGTLSICSDTDAENYPSRTGFKLRVSVGHTTGLPKTNIFKFFGENERDLWKSFILGISRGFVPNDVELLPKQRDKVHDAIREIWNTASHFLPWSSPTNSTPSSDHNSPRASCPSRSSRHLRSVSPEDEELHGTRTLRDECEVQEVANGLQVNNTLEQLKKRQIELSRKELSSEEPDDAVRRSGSTSRSGNGGLESDRKKHLMESGKQDLNLSSLCPQGTIVDARKCDNNNSRYISSHEVSLCQKVFFHLFFTDLDLNRHQPEWFVDCSREEAEDHLLRAHKSGNVLMRKSSSFQANGKYVISLRRGDRNGRPSISHYSVVRCKDGFKIEVSNQHNAMRSLSEVMDFFMSVAGCRTRPISSTELCIGHHGSLPDTPPSPPVLCLPLTPL